MKKFKIVFALLVVFSLAFVSQANATCICYWSSKGEAGTWMEGSCFEGGSSCGLVCFCEQ